MFTNTVTQDILEIPDRTDSLHQRDAGGDVLSAISKAAEAQLRAISFMAPEPCMVTNRFHFYPDKEDPQSRLRISQTISASEDVPPETVSMISLIGPTASFYKTAMVLPEQPQWEDFPYVCEIDRRVNLIPSIVAPEFNPRVPPCYFMIHPLESDSRNDYLEFVKTFGPMKEEAVVEIRAASTDGSPELQASQTYLARLENVNRGRGDDDETLIGMDYVGGEKARFSSSWNAFKTSDRDDPMADQVLHHHRRFHNSLFERHLQFGIYIFAKTEAASRILACSMAECAFRKGSYHLRCHRAGSSRHGAIIKALRGGNMLSSELPHFNGAEQGVSLYRDFERLAGMARVDELLGAFHLPAATHGGLCCLRKTTDPPPVLSNDAIKIGTVDIGRHDDSVNASPRIWLCILELTLTKHAIFLGGTGQGKTLLNEYLLFQIKKVAFICFEGSKKEYRELLTLREHPDEAIRGFAREIRVYTPGNDSVSPFRLNPLRIPPGVSVDNHIRGLISRFRAAQSLPGPLELLMTEALYEVYETHPDPSDPPVMKDLLPASVRVLARKGYSSDVHSDLSAALEVRLGRFTRGTVGGIFSGPYDYPNTEDILSQKIILELAELDPEDMSFISLCLMSNIRRCLEHGGSSRDKLKLLFIFEEPQNIFGRSSEPVQTESFSDPKAHATQYLLKNLAEIRALGGGIILNSTTPALLPDEVIKCAATKVIFGLPSADDRQALGKHALLSEAEIDDLGRKKPGEAILMTEGFLRPCAIRTVNFRREAGLTDPPRDSELRALLEETDWFRKESQARAAMELISVAQEMDQSDAERAALLHAASELESHYIHSIGKPDAGHRLRALRREALRLVQRVEKTVRKLSQGTCRTLLYEVPDHKYMDPVIPKSRQALRERYNRVMQTEVPAFLSAMKSFAVRCSPSY